jgi:hypothetical protein
MSYSICKYVASYITIFPGTHVLDWNLDQTKTVISLENKFHSTTSEGMKFVHKVLHYFSFSYKNFRTRNQSKKKGSENSKKTCFRLVLGLVKNPNLNRMYLQ